MAKTPVRKKAAPKPRARKTPPRKTPPRPTTCTPARMAADMPGPTTPMSASQAIDGLDAGDEPEATHRCHW